MKPSLNRLFTYTAILLAAAITWSAAAQDPNPPSIKSNRGAWKITRQWTPGETQHFAEWMEHLFDMKTKGSTEQRIAKIERMLTDPEMNLLEQPSFLGEGGNKQLPLRIIRSAHSVIDCAKLTSFLPAYYAYRRGLPWMVTHVWSPSGADIRQSPYNIPSGVSSSFTGSLGGFFSSAINGFASGNYRVELNRKNSEWSDSVPVAIDPKYLMPGCINYVDGHCLILAKVTPYGDLRFLNSSTTHTRDIFTYSGMNTVTGITPRGADPENEWGGCFQGLRVMRYPIAETNSKGIVTHVRRRTDAEMVEFGYSTEQYERLNNLVSRVAINESGVRPESFHDFIRLRMKSVDTLSPVAFMDEYVDEILEVFTQREAFVQEAWKDVLKNGGIVYPERREKENIFQAYGRWESWSSPSSDVDRRNKYFYLSDWLDYAIRWYGMDPKTLDMTGLNADKIETQADLARALVEYKNELFVSHTFTYRNSRGEPILLSLNDIERRLYDLSYDPNHPPELRWGAPMTSEERATAVPRTTPLPGGAKIGMDDSYLLQTYYRTVTNRETEMSFLREMFTDGFPKRKKLEGQLAKWEVYNEPSDAILAWLDEREGRGTNGEPPHVLVPHEYDVSKMDEPKSVRKPAPDTQPSGGGSLLDRASGLGRRVFSRDGGE